MPLTVYIKKCNSCALFYLLQKRVSAVQKSALLFLWKLRACTKAVCEYQVAELMFRVCVRIWKCSALRMRNAVEPKLEAQSKEVA